MATRPAGSADATTRPVSGHGWPSSTPTSTFGTSSRYSMTLRQPRSMPPARRHAQTSSSSCRHSVGNSSQVVVAATTAVGRGCTSSTVTS